MPTIHPIDNSSQITFKNKSGGSTYEYPNFTTTQLMAFLGADSKDIHFRDHIKSKTDVHPHRKLDPSKDVIWS